MLPSSTSNELPKLMAQHTFPTDSIPMSSAAQTPSPATITTSVPTGGVNSAPSQQAMLWQNRLQQMLPNGIFSAPAPAAMMMTNMQNAQAVSSNRAQHASVTACAAPSTATATRPNQTTGKSTGEHFRHKEQKLASVPSDQISAHTGICLGGSSNNANNAPAALLYGLSGTNVAIPAGSGNTPTTTDEATTKRRASSSYSAASNAAVHAHDKLRHEEVIHAMRLNQNPVDMIMFRPDAPNMQSEPSKGKEVDVAIVPPLQGMTHAKSCRMSQGPTLFMDSSANKESVGVVVAGKRSSPVTAPSPQRPPHKYRRVVGGKASVPEKPSSEDMSPQTYLDDLLKSRGYSTKSFCSLEGGYYCKPTPLQKASYGTKVVQAIRTSDDTLLKRFLQCGLSRNPCNAFGESVLHMVCRRGNHKLLKTLVDHGCYLQVSDDFGRTPLHDACWTAEPNFECVELILEADVRLLHIADCRGASPLSYVKRDNWGRWIDFFNRKKETFWPHRDVKKDGEEPPPELCQEAAHSKPVPDPRGAADLRVATLIASGQADMDEVIRKQGESKLEAKGNTEASSTTMASTTKTQESKGISHSTRPIMPGESAVAISHITSPA